MLRIAVSFLALFALSSFAGAQPAPGILRVMSYNIHHGEGLDQKLDLARIAQVILDARADIAGLQEVDRGVERTQRRDLPAELAKLTGLHVAFENNHPFQGGEYGNAILSRFPIKRVRNTRFKMLQPGEQRGVLQAVIDVNGRDVLCLNTHLDYRPHDAERLMNVGELKSLLTTAGSMPVILVGDFNATPDSRTIGNLKAFLADTWEMVGQGNGFSIPVKKPAKRIDYIWITKDSLQPLRMEVLRSEASDHLPILAELRLK